MQEYIKYADVYRKEYGSEFDKVTRRGKKYRLSNEEERKIDNKVQLSKMTKNQESGEIVKKNKDLLMAFAGESLHPFAVVDKDSHYPRIDTGYVFTPDKEVDFIQDFSHSTFNQFKDQASTILWVTFYKPKNLLFQHLPVKKDVDLDTKGYEDGNRLRNGFILQILTNDIDEIVKIGGRTCNIYEGVMFGGNFKVSPFEKIIGYLFKKIEIWERKTWFDGRSCTLMYEFVKWTTNQKR